MFNFLQKKRAKVRKKNDIRKRARRFLRFFEGKELFLGSYRL